MDVAKLLQDSPSEERNLNAKRSGNGGVSTPSTPTLGPAVGRASGGGSPLVGGAVHSSTSVTPTPTPGYADRSGGHYHQPPPHIHPHRSIGHSSMDWERERRIPNENLNSPSTAATTTGAALVGPASTSAGLPPPFAGE